MPEIDWSALQTPDFAGNALRAQTLGRQDGLAMAKQNALRAYASDPQGAIGQLASVDPAAADQLLNLNTAQTKVAAGKDAAGKYAAGDLQGALQAYAPTGDIQGISALHGQIIEQQTRQIDYLAKQASKWQTIYARAGGDQNPAAKEQLAAAFDADAPYYQSVAGATPDRVQQLKNQILSNPGAALPALANPPKITFHTAGDTLFAVNDDTGQKVGAWTGDKFITLNNPDGGQSVAQVGGDGGAAPGGAPGQPAPATTASAPVPAPGGAQAPSAAGAGGLDAQDFYRNFVLKHEGGLNPSDMNGSPTNMGFNQAANPDIDVHKLTPDTAAQRFATNYFGPSGAAKLPPAMAAVYSDTYFINPSKAKEFLQQSGGDPSKFMGLREAWMDRMLQTNPAAQPYAKAWATRNADLRQYADGLATPAQQGGAAPGGQGAAPGVRILYNTSGNGESDLTDDSVQLLAARYLRDGTIPPLGMKSTADRRRILNAATKMASDLGLSAGDLIAGTADTKAAGKALAQNASDMQRISGFEKTAEANADLALSLAPAGGATTKIPVLNRWIQAGRKSIAGDADVAKFDVALGTFADEYAKVVAGSNGSTDSVRSEAYRRINGAMTQQQLAEVIGTMKKEMANRMAAMQAVDDGIRSRLRGGPAASPSEAPAAAPHSGGRPPLTSFDR